MTEQIQIGLFEKLKLKDWYKYMLYVSGILLILVMFLDAKIEQSKIIEFSLWTIGISCFVWICDSILTTIFDYYETQREEDEPVLEEQKVIAAIQAMIHVLIFLFWAFFIARKLF
jgi:uncharacterized protein with PQ loop repeat